MSNSYRIRTQVGADNQVVVNLEQDYDFLEILSLKITKSEVYSRLCSDYGVVVGRVVANGGYGVPNAKISVFVPLSQQDEEDPVISTLYPYKSVTDKNEDGYRYNLLPYVSSYTNHVPTGTFPTENDVLTDSSVIEVYDKYYRFVVKTNESGDFMIMGVPLGQQVVFMDLDLSDMGPFSFSPQDLIRVGRATEAQVNGSQFKASTDLTTLPQIISISKVIDVQPFWGSPDLCLTRIQRVDFDLREEADINIQPTAVFMGSLVSTSENRKIKRNCKPTTEGGDLCGLVVGPGSISTVRQTIQVDSNGRPILESFELDNNGKVIDDNGTWLVDLPMNMDYVTTNEFGEQIISADPRVGIPTSSRYRFKVKWQQSNNLDDGPKRAYFLVPNVREHGWTSGTDDPNYYTSGSSQYTAVQKSYAFSLDWDDYYDYNAAVNCEDTFYLFKYNKVYTVSQLMDGYQNGQVRGRFIGIKEITSTQCESENYKFPVTDAVRNFDLFFTIINILLPLLSIILYPLIIVIHIISFVWPLLRILLFPTLATIVFILRSLCLAVNKIPGVNLTCPQPLKLKDIPKQLLQGITLPNLSYPDCEVCNCNSFNVDDTESIEYQDFIANAGDSALTNIMMPSGYDAPTYLLDYQKEAINQVFGGYDGTENDGAGFKCSYGIVEKSDGTDVSFWSYGVNLPERLNLFNTKSKYYDYDVAVTYRGGGPAPNRIKVTVRPDLPSNAGKFHYDNIMVLMVEPGTLQTLSAGTIMSFVDPKYSKDPNPNKTYTDLEDSGITGTSINTSSINVTWADPTTQFGGNNITTYAVSQTAGVKQVKFPTDIEYFQVITGYTYGDIQYLADGAWNNSLKTGFLATPTYVYSNEGSGTWNNPTAVPGSPYYSLANVQDYLNQEIVILVRGVDPNSERMNITYDISRILGKQSWGQHVVTGNYKLNIPIRNSEFTVNSNHNLVLPRHQNVTSNGTGSEGKYLFYPSYSIQVGNDFQIYNTDNLKYYSAMDSSVTTNNFPNNSIVGDKSAFDLTVNGEVILINRYMGVYNINNKFVSGNPDTPFGVVRGRPYYPGEYVEGASFMFIDNFDKPRYYSYGYSYLIEANSLNFGTLVNDLSRIVIRTDRLPTSSTEERYNNNSFVLHQSRSFNISVFSDNGIAIQTSLTTAGQDDTNAAADFSGNTLQNAVVNAFACSTMTNFECYSGTGFNFGVYPQPNDCYTNAADREVLDNGCFKLVNPPFRSLVGRNNDFKLVGDWLSRFRITFASCRGVFGHTFTNSWVNGNLFAFTIQNDRFFDSNNNPFSRYCKDLVVLHEATNTYYYRSAPYNDTTNLFIGKTQHQTAWNYSPSSPVEYQSQTVGNRADYLFPTTIMDLGPRESWIKEVVLNLDYEGYVMDQLPVTSFSDTSDLLSLFLISRLINKNFWSRGNIQSFFSREGDRVDGDFAQMLQINSMFGVNGFDFDNYSVTGTTSNPIYLDENVMGVFYTGNTVLRDLISPRRVVRLQDSSRIVSDSVPTYSQKVPYYYWKIYNDNTDTGVSNNLIFGLENNNWEPATTQNIPLSGTNYQELDRMQTPYFQPNPDNPLTNLGYIFKLNNQGGYDPIIYNMNNDKILQGSPFYFYFGLKRGKSAMDRFITKYIKPVEEL